MQRLCVFCGSSRGADPAYAAAAERVGTLIAGRGITLVYGGGDVGLMGIVADAALARGGQVIGVIPQALVALEVAHRNLPDLRVVETMHQRKGLMADLADGFVALPGGIGTLEELCEILTWAQLGMHRKPCGVLNVRGYFDGLLAFLDHAVAERFLRPEHREMVVVAGEPEELLDAFAAYAPPEPVKLVDRRVR